MPIKIQGTPWSEGMADLLKQVQRQAFICLTHIVTPTVDLLLQNLPPRVKLRVLVRIDKVTLNSESLRRLTGRIRTEVRVLKNLNSKLYLLDRRLAILAGSNLTLEGMEHNVSFYVIIEDHKIVGELLSRLEQYWQTATVIGDVSAVIRTRGADFGTWVEPIPGPPIEFASYEDVLVERLKTKIRKNPEDPGTHHSLGDLHHLRGDSTGAAEAYRKALSLDPDLNEARLSLARCLWDQGDPEECLHEVLEVLKRDGENAEAHRLSAIIYERRGARELALEARKSYERLAGKK